jgi:glycosyltransferase involved in cell wall biosynthesis
VSAERIRQNHSHRHAARRELGIHDDEVLVGTVANFRAQKGYQYLLEAARLIAEKRLPVRFVAVGQGLLEREIAAIHRSKRLGDRFLILGYREDAGRILAACDIFALSSLFEGIPLALMEALVLGLPVVATAVGGIPEAVTQGREGLLVPPGRPDLLAAAIQTLVAQPDVRQRMGLAARERGESFEVARAARTIEGIYRGLIQDRNGDRAR